MCLLKPPPLPSPVRFEAIPSALSLFESNLHLGAQEREKNTSGQWNCLVTQKGVIIEINHPILFHNWTLPRLTFQWHLPSRLSYHMHSPNSSFVCQENSEPPLVGLVWQCNLHRKVSTERVGPKDCWNHSECFFFFLSDMWVIKQFLLSLSNWLT